MKSIARAGLAHYRWAVFSRAIAAVLGGYALAYIAAAGMSVWLPMARADAVLTATMLAFVIYALAVMWVFFAHNTLRAWAGIVVPTAVLAILFWIT